MTSKERTKCHECNEEIVQGICRSAAGYYVGSYCGCGPYSRDSQYFKKREEAERYYDWSKINDD